MVDGFQALLETSRLSSSSRLIVAENSGHDVVADEPELVIASIHTVDAFFLHYLPEQPWQRIAGVLLWSAVNFSAIMLIRLIRLEVSKACSSISPLLPKGEDQYKNIFQSIANPFPPLLLGTVLFLAFFNFNQEGLQAIPTDFGRIYQFLSSVIMYYVYGTTFWVFLGALWGLYIAGHSPLHLKSYIEDSNLGALPLGQLSLNLARLYFVLLGLLLAIALISPVSTAFLGLLFVDTALGLMMFFLPLNGVHQQMKRSRKNHLEDIGSRVVAVLSELEPTTTEKPGGDPSLPQPAQAQLAKIEALRILEQRANAVPVWPLDTEIIQHLAAVVLPILIGIEVGYFTKILDL